MDREYRTERPVAPQVVFDVTSVNGMVIVTNVLMALLMAFGMMRDRHSTTAAVVVAGVYFLVSTFLIVLVLSGSLTNMVISRQREITERRKWQVMDANAGEPFGPAPALQLPGSHHADRLQAPSFVAPVEDGVRREAYAWLLSLFDAAGNLDGRRVILNPTGDTPAGRVRVKMPSKSAIDYLMARGVLRQFVDSRNHPNGYGVRLRALPHRDALTELDI